ncbi:MAG TPA: HlyD family efflux transporter periplasmic adaptor subunit [Bryobacteraceae bacterium]|nr:HlyD family efflux transporter periplasmic adaptor subunit [Bryobacteraceae bacterium]
MSGPAAASTAPPSQRARRPRFIPLLLAAVIIAAGIFVWKKFIATPPVPDSIVQLSGRIEGDDSALAPKTSGRILEVRVREGDTVKAGDIIATLDEEQIKAREAQARASLMAADARSMSAKSQTAILQAQLTESQLQAEQSIGDAAGRVRQAQADMAAAESDLAQQEASYQLALFDKDAYTRLAKTGAVSERQGRQSESTANQQAAAVAAGRRRVEAARGSLTTAEATLSNRGIREAQVATVRRQIAQQEAEIANAAANRQAAKFQLEEAEANRQDLTVTAPFSGTVITRAAEPGEVVTAGTAIVTLLDLSKVYLRGFVPEGQIGRVKVGQPARVYIDSHPNQPIEASVLRIDPQATFTPENTYFHDDRVKQVLGVKLLLKGAAGFAKPGMPADGEVLVNGDTWPESRTR